MLGVDTLGIYLVQIFLSVIISGYERFISAIESLSKYFCKSWPFGHRGYCD